MSSASSYVSGESKSKPTGAAEKVVVDLNYLNQVDHFTDNSISTEDLELIASHLDDYTIEAALKIVEEAIEYHRGDSCLNPHYYSHLEDLARGPSANLSKEEWEVIVKFDAFLIHDWSIYPEVRSVTRPIDEDEYEHYESIRMYLLTIVWSCAGSALATFFNVRFPSISLGTSALQILIAYSGRLLSGVPGFSIPLGFGNRIHWGSGSWNYKEQVLATIATSTGNTAPDSQAVVIAMANSNFFGFKDAQGNFGFVILLTLVVNLLGFGISGLLRVFLVYPVRMLTYNVLPPLRLSRILIEPDERENINGWTLKGWEFFVIFSIAEFIWYWICDFVFIFLSTIDWISWIAPENNNLLTICNVNSGLGINPFSSLDPSIFGTATMVSPFYATFSATIIGMGMSTFVLIGIWYMNVSWSGYMPINSNSLYDNTGEPYDVRQVINDNYELDEAKLSSYSLPFWSAGNLVDYGSTLAIYPAMIVFTALNYGRDITYSFKVFFKTLLHPGKTLANFDDRFTRAQRKYKEVPEWWYLVTFAIFIALAIVLVECFRFTNTPVWTIFFGIGLNVVFLIPIGILTATTNQSISLNLLFELVIGVTNTGNAYALMVSKILATDFLSEADGFVSNLKCAHYAGIAPRSLFRAQLITCIINSFVQSSLVYWQSIDGSIQGLCNLNNRERFTCQGTRSYFNAAIQWGTIGPKRVFDNLYPRMPYCFLLGALLPIPFWLMRNVLLVRARTKEWGSIKDGASRLRNHKFVRYLLGCEWIIMLNEIIILQGAASWAPMNWLYFWESLWWGFAFQVVIPKYYPRWWQKYNYLLYSALSVGMSYAGLIMFFSTQYKHMVSLDWWGNDTGVSLSPGPRLFVENGTTFGPSSW